MISLESQITARTYTSSAHIPNAPTLTSPYALVCTLTSQNFVPGPVMKVNRRRKAARTGQVKKMRLYAVAGFIGSDCVVFESGYRGGIRVHLSMALCYPSV